MDDIDTDDGWLLNWTEAAIIVAVAVPLGLALFRYWGWL